MKPSRAVHFPSSSIRASIVLGLAVPNSSIPIPHARHLRHPARPSTQAQVCRRGRGQSHERRAEHGRAARVGPRKRRCWMNGGEERRRAEGALPPTRPRAEQHGATPGSRMKPVLPHPAVRSAVQHAGQFHNGQQGRGGRKDQEMTSCVRCAVCEIKSVAAASEVMQMRAGPSARAGCQMRSVTRVVRAARASDATRQLAARRTHNPADRSRLLLAICKAVCCEPPSEEKQGGSC